MLLAEVVAASEEVAATPARSAKVAVLAELLRRLEPDEIVPAAGFLIAQLRQGKIGVGWSTAFRVEIVTPASTGTLTVADLDTAIDELAAMTGPGSAEARRERLTALFEQATANEADFIRRLFTGELRQGALAGVLADAIAKASGCPLAAVRRAAMLSGDLIATARVALLKGAAGLGEMRLEPLRPVLPMLASTAPSAAEAIALCGESSVEWKLDGARLQAHRAGGEVRLFTRNGNDVTARMPTVVSIVMAMPCDEVVLDGEAVGFGDDDRPDAFQSTMSRFGRTTAPGDRDPLAAGGLAVRFFDCLYLDGRMLIDEPLLTRVAALDHVAAAWRVPSVITDDPEVAHTFLAAALDAGHEGVVVKSVGSTYDAGRRGGSWRKVKPVRTFDLVVLAAEWGHGRRRGWLSNLHLGARDTDGDGGFVMVGKTFKGMTDQLLAWQTEALLALRVEERGIQVHVRPELVVEVAIDGVQRSTRYPGGVALRFARIKGYRDDKPPNEADTIDSLRALL